MPPPRIVEELDVLDDRVACVRACRPRGVPKQLDFQRREEALRHGVVPAVGASTHAGDHAVPRQQALILGTDVLPKFNRSSQHRTERGCDDDTKKAFGTGRTSETTLARPALGSAA